MYTLARMQSAHGPVVVHSILDYGQTKRPFEARIARFLATDGNTYHAPLDEISLVEGMVVEAQ